MNCEVLITGAGPAGMAAAAAAARAGARVVLLDDNPTPGGQIWRGHADAAGTWSGGAYERLAERLRGVEVLCGALVVAQPGARTLRIEDAEGTRDVRHEKLILATGARERFLPFPGWTLPGVMGAGGLQALVKSGLPIAGKRVVLAGSGPLLLAVGANLAKAGASIAGVFEQAPLTRLLRFGLALGGHPGKLAEGVRYRAAMGYGRYRTDSWVAGAHGDGQLRSVTLSVRGVLRELACDYLGCGFHLTPNLELARMLGCRVDEGHVAVDAMQRTSAEGVFCAGELTGVGGLEKALVEGEIAGLASAGKDARHLYARRDRQRRFATALDAAFALRPELRRLADAQTIVCRCEDVQFGDVAKCRTWREAKLHTRCGMGACQGRVCGSATEFLFGWENDSVRPPLTPARMETLAADGE